MSIEDNKARALAVSHAIADGVLRARVDDLLTPEFRFHGSAGAEMGRDAYVAFYEGLGAALRDMKMTFHHVIAEGDVVAVRFTNDAVHAGPFMGLPATHKAVRVHGMFIRRIEAGRVSEEWASLDMLGLLKQLGVDPRAR